MACDPFWNKTVLACHFDGSNGSTTFTDEKGNTLTAGGNAKLTTTSPKFGTACLLLDGNGDYVSTDSSILSGHAGDVTIECWFKAAGTPTGNTYNTAYYVMSYGPNKTNLGLDFYVGSSQIKFGHYDYASPVLTGNWTPDTAWHHLAVVRSVNVWSMYLDGVQIASASNSTAFYTHSGTIGIGGCEAQSGGENTGWFNGTIDDIRITKAARYPVQFTPDSSAFVSSQCAISDVVLDANGSPAKRLVRLHRRDSGAVVGLTLSDATTGEYLVETEHVGEHFVMAHDTDGVDPYLSSVKLAIKMDIVTTVTNFVDETGKSPSANGNVRMFPATGQMAHDTAYFDGSGDYISVPYSTDFDVGSGDFTIECWFMVPNVSGQKTLFAFNTDFHLGVFLNGNRLSCFASSNGSGWNMISGDTGGNLGAGYTDVQPNVWNHFAWTRYGTTWTLWLNGKADRQLVGISGAVVTRNEAFNVGRWGNNGYWLSGHIDDFRLTKGVCRYTAPFAPPLLDFIEQPSAGTENAVILDRMAPV